MKEFNELTDGQKKLVEEAIADLEQQNSYVTVGKIDDYLRLVKRVDIPWFDLKGYVERRSLADSTDKLSFILPASEEGKQDEL